MYEITGDIDELRELTKGIKAAEPALKKATVRSLNRTIVSGRTFLVKMISRDYRVTQKAIRKELIIARANYRRMLAKIVGEGSPGIPLYQFAPTPKRVPSTRRTTSGGYTPKGGIKVMVTRGARKMVSGAFIAMMTSGHIGIFRRKERGTGNWWQAFSGGEEKIEELYGPSPLRLLDQDRYQIPMDEFVGDEMEKNMAREARFYLKRYKVIPDA